MHAALSIQEITGTSPGTSPPQYIPGTLYYYHFTLGLQRCKVFSSGCQDVFSITAACAL